MTTTTAHNHTPGVLVAGCEPCNSPAAVSERQHHRARRRAAAAIVAASTAYTAESLRAGRAKVDADELRDKVADRIRALTVAEEDARQKAAAQVADTERLLRALVNRDQSEPIRLETATRWDGRTVEYRAALGTVRIHQVKRARTSAPRVIATAFPAHIEADRAAGRPWGASAYVTVYEPDKGTNDPDKLAEQWAEAERRAVEYLTPLTGAAYLKAAGVEPIDPAGLLTVEAWARADVGTGHPGTTYRPSLTISAGARIMDGGLPLTSTATHDLLYGYGNDRRAVLSPATREKLDELTRGATPFTELDTMTPDDPQERERRLLAIRRLIESDADHIARAWLAGFVTSTELVR